MFEIFIRNFYNYEQSDWAELLPMAEYSYNKSVHSTTRLTSFYIDYEYYPCTNWLTVANIKYPAIDIYVHYLKTLHERCQENLERP
jgi:hypothetical protein